MDGDSRRAVIVARATPCGSSALALVRVSGAGSASLVEDLLGLESDRLSGSRRAVGVAFDSEGPIDEVVAISWKAGGSYTGEEMVEISCHGVLELVDRIVGELERRGARAALPGEFTRRALLNDRMSAFDVIALSSLWNHHGAGEGFGGRELTEMAAQVLEGIRDSRALLEGRIEFGESHLVGPDGEETGQLVLDLSAEASRLSARVASIPGQGRVLIAGPRNSGKSSLFNRLLGRRRALVSADAGTTRDAVAESVEVGGRVVELVDTAGSDGGEMEIEALSIVLGELSSTDRVIWLSELGSEDPADWIEEKGLECLVACGKCDLGKGHGYRVSAVSGEGIEQLREWIADDRGGIAEGLRSGMNRVEESIRAAAKAITAGEEALAAEELLLAEETLRALCDGSAVEEAVETALRRLCVGK
jgi:tRNA modification GTPase